MKKLTALLLITALICACFSGGAFTAFADSLDRAMNTAKPELYGMYTIQSGNVLRDRFDRAAALKAAGGTNAAMAIPLRNALNGLVPLENYERVELGGFGGLTDADISAMRLNSGAVSASDGVITLAGEGALRYCNAVRGGIAGPSPFGDVSGADGLALMITASTDASLDFGIGARGENNSVFTISDVFVSEGERYYFFPFDRFGCAPDEALNYISLTFTGAGEISFRDLHGVAGALDGAKTAPRPELPLDPQQLNGRMFCRILQKGTGLALKMVSPKETGNNCCIFAENDPDDDAQLWLICGTGSGTAVRIINKHFASALCVTSSSNPYISASRPNLTASEQVWNYSYNKNRGWSFTISGLRFGYFNSSVRINPATAAVKYFDIVSAGEQGWTTTWSDEFDGSSVNRDVWNVRDGVVDGDENCYAFRDSDNNVYVENGNLVIHTFKEQYRDRPATSGHISTEDKVQFGYGRYEFRVKMPEGPGVFPALWMMGNDDHWPRTGEIDILEMVGTGEADDWKGEKKNIATFHYAGDSGEHVEAGGYTDEGFLYTPERISLDYHIYAIEWENDQIRWYFDDILYFTLNADNDALRNAFQENPMYIRINVALHGPGNYQLPENMTEAFMYVDYFRYMKAPTSALPQNDICFDRSITSHDYSHEFAYPANAGAAPAAQDKMLYACGSSEFKVFDVNNLSEISYNSFRGERDWIKTSAFSADGSRIALGCTGSIGVSDVRLRSPKRIDFASATPVVALSADGSRCYAGGQPNDGSGFCDYFYIYNASDMNLIKREYTGSWVDSIAAHGSGVYAYGCYDGSVHVRSASDEDLGNYGVGGRVVDIAFSPDGGRIYTADGGCNIYAYDIASGAVSLLASLGDEPYRIVVSPDGTRLAAACGDSCARVYDTADGKLAARPCLGRLFVTAVNYSVDGRLLLLGCTDGKIGVFRADDGYPLALLTENNIPRWFDTVVICADNSAVMSIRRVYDFLSGPIGWKLPAALLPSDGGDASALDALTFYDETAYTPESYAPYAAALNNAQAVRANRYSKQSVIDAAAQALSEAAAALEEKTFKGDLDGDGDVTVSDALRALRFAAGLAEADENALRSGDIDGDGAITVSDALAILRVAVKLADTL